MSGPESNPRDDEVPDREEYEKAMATQNMTPMPKYKCHKEVWALKIAELTRNPDGSLLIVPAEAGYGAFTVEAKFVPIHNDAARPEVGWYYVVYEDGYRSFSPAKAFEDGYTLIGG